MRTHRQWIWLSGIFVLVLTISLMPIQPAFAYLVTDDGEPVHEYMVSIAASMISNTAINNALDTIKAGAGHEDVLDHVTDLGGLYVTLTHFWDADKGDDDPADMVVTHAPAINSWQKAKILWGMALGEYMDGDYGAAYEYLGHVAHLLADQSVPAHAHEDQHATETYEKDYMLMSNGNPILGADELLDLWNKGPVEIPEDVNPLYYLFYTMNQIGDYYPCDEEESEYEGDADTRGGWMDQVYADLGVYPISQPVSDADCAVIREYSYKFAIRAIATLFQLFEDAATRRSALTVVIDHIQALDVHDGGLAAPDCYADFYANINIEGRWFFNEGDQVLNEDDIYPGWAFGRQVGVTGSKSVVIQIFDEDEDPNFDDKTDLDPVEDQWDLDLSVNLDTGEITGDVTGMCGETLVSAGTDHEDDHSQIWFRILLPNIPPTAHAGDDQTADEGDTVSLNGTFEDPNAEDTHTFLWHLKSSTNGQTISDATTQNMSFIPNDNGVYTFEFTVTDNYGASGSDEVVITVNNVDPTASIDHLTDEMGYEIGSEVPVTLIGLKTSLTGSFTDVGTADTHTAGINWGDGTIDTNMAQFSDSTGGVTGLLGDAHTYVTPGDYTIQASVTDDDGGTAADSAPITVVDASGALASVIDILTPLADHPDIQAAIDWLQGEQDSLAWNGALDMLDLDDPYAAIQMIKLAVICLEDAEAADPLLDLGMVKSLLALSAKSLAVGAIAAAEVVAAKSSALKKISQARALVLAGDQALMGELKYVDAVARYQEALRVVLGIK